MEGLLLTEPTHSILFLWYKKNWGTPKKKKICEGWLKLYKEKFTPNKENVKIQKKIKTFHNKCFHSFDNLHNVGSLGATYVTILETSGTHASLVHTVEARTEV